LEWWKDSPIRQFEKSIRPFVFRKAKVGDIGFRANYQNMKFYAGITFSPDFELSLQRSQPLG
jgi:hypothetical protein